MNPGKAASATLWMRVASGLEVLTGLGLVVAPSLLARLLFGSDLNGAGEATGRISGLVMLCLAAGCWPRAAGAEAHALAPLMALSWLAAAFLIATGLVGANVGMLLWPAAARSISFWRSCSRAPGWKAGAQRDDETPRGESTLARVRGLGGSSAPEGLERTSEMKKATLLGCAAVLSAIGWAKADPVDLSAYVDANGFIDVQALTCAQLANTYQSDANVLMAWYSGWYNGLGHKHYMDYKKGRELKHLVIEYCKAHLDESIIHAIGVNLKGYAR